MTFICGAFKVLRTVLVTRTTTIRNPTFLMLNHKPRVTTCHTLYESYTPSYVDSQFLAKILKPTNQEPTTMSCSSDATHTIPLHSKVLSVAHILAQDCPLLIFIHNHIYAYVASPQPTISF